MLCHVMLRHVMLRHVMLRHVMLCHVMLRHVILRNVMLRHVMLCESSTVPVPTWMSPCVALPQGVLLPCFSKGLMSKRVFFNAFEISPNHDIS